ncbi:MAG: ACT domain-containing protein, partial [Clostridia bacterium]|nr:ACT domain-containing protein [Clostridia bacterium]
IPGIAFKIFNKLAQKNINVDIILQSVGRNNTKDIAFTVNKDNAPVAIAALRELAFIGDELTINCDTDVAKVSVVGAGMETHPGTASKMFEALYNSDINIQMISTSEIKISVLIDAKDADKAVIAVHDAFLG